MKTVIVYAHPRHKGHNWSIRQSVERQLKQKKIKYTLIDLYVEKFDPIMYADQHYTSGGYERDALQKKYQELLNDSTHMIYIYPVWWNEMPAMLKGFFDKIFVGRLAFRYKKFPIIPFPIPIGLWKGKRAVIFTTSGAKNWQTFLVQGSRFKKIITNDILKFCGIKGKNYTLDGCLDNYDGKSREKEIERLVTKGLKWLY